MLKMIDVRGLPDEDVKFVEKIVEVLKKRAGEARGQEREDIAFSAWPLGVKGKLTRQEIYDYL
jgi:hypothetical protein